MKKLFLLKPDFQDVKLNADSKYFCPTFTVIEVIITYNPHLKINI